MDDNTKRQGRREIRSKVLLRERCRVRAMAFAFSGLRERLPHLPEEYQLTQIQTLQRAIEYIGYLRTQLESKERVSSRATDHEKLSPNGPRKQEKLQASSPCRSHPHLEYSLFSESADVRGSLSTYISFGRCIPSHRVKWNTTCRQRSRKVAEAFDDLREVLRRADFIGEEHTSQCTTLRQAISCIRTLREVLERAKIEERHEKKELEGDLSFMTNCFDNGVNECVPDYLRSCCFADTRFLLFRQ